MDDKESQQSPAQPPEQWGSPFADEPIVAEAVAVEPAEPRLGIIHLLAWTAGVAVYFSLFRTVIESGRNELTAVYKALWALHGFGGGAALAGLGLFVARRLRGVSFPKHPGEYLLLVLGVGTLYNLVFQGYWFLIRNENEGMDSSDTTVLMVYYATAAIIAVTIYLIAARRVKIRRWRVFFVTSIVAVVLEWFVLCVGLLLHIGGYGVAQVIGLVPNAVLFVVVLMDLVGRKPYPWPHFLGVGLKCWFAAMGFAWFVIAFLFPETLY